MEAVQDGSMVQTFRISPLIRFTLYGLLVVLVLPLPFILVRQGQMLYLGLTLAGTLLGGVFLVGLMAQRVVVDGQGVRVEYPTWVPVRGWRLAWTEVAQLKTRATGQGGRVHYLTNHQGEAFLLPMRIAGFAQFLRLVEAQTQLDTTTVKPLAQPWMYLTLLVCVGVMFFIDLWIVGVALTLPN